MAERNHQEVEIKGVGTVDWQSASSTIGNVITGESQFLYYKMKASFLQAEEIDIIVSFLMESGVKLLLEDLRQAIQRGAKIRILTGQYLNITQPSALYLLKREFGDAIDLRFYNNPKVSFHPKSYMFRGKESNEVYIGSSNLSYGALTNSVEWNYRLTGDVNKKDVEAFEKQFNQLFLNHSYIISDEVLSTYSKGWKRPSVFRDLESNKRNDEEKESVDEPFKPRDAQIEALYCLEKTREEGFDKGLVVAATGIGKTYLAAFDSSEFETVLFVAHREEILMQAAKSFRDVRKSDDYGFFYGEYKETKKRVIFALVQTLGKEGYLQESYFAKDYFKYMIIDEFHHAAAGNYANILKYFKPKFLLGLTATPERLDAKNVFALCDYNVVYEVRLKEAIEKGWLVPFRYYGVYDETVNYDSIPYEGGKYKEKDLEEALSLHQRSELIYNHYKKYHSVRALGFCSSRKHAEFMAEAFCSYGVAAVAVHSGEEGEYTSERTKAIEDLKEGKIQVIFSVDMFNEGLDIASVDMVLFLRPTQSPTVFLQQLGRGLRKSEGKKYVTVLDFIGNYKKANLIPVFLSGKACSSVATSRYQVMEEEFPEGCVVDFDFRLIDLFQKQASKGMKKEDRIREQYIAVREKLGRVPSRMELFTYMEDEVYEICRSNSKISPFKGYLEFLKKEGELAEKDEVLLDSFAGKFIKMIETTSMSKSYKLPVFLAFYNGGRFKMEVAREDVYLAFYNFYHRGGNRVDMLKDRGTRNFDDWGETEYVRLAVNNPVKFMLKTHEEFFCEKEGFVLGIKDELRQWIGEERFLEQVRDAIEYRPAS